MLKAPEWAKTTALLAAIAAFLIWVSYVLWSTEEFQNCLDQEIKAEQTSAKSEENLQGRFFARVALARHDTICGTRVLDDHGEAITALGTGFIALFTFTLWLSTKRLWSEAKRASAIAKESAEAAKDGALAASRSVETMEDTARKQLRAYVWQTAKSEPILSDDGYIVRIEIRNTGATTAHNVHCWAQMDAVDLDSIEHYEFVTPPDTNYDPRFVINPGALHTLTAMRLVPQKIEEDVRDGFSALCAWGEIRYEDIYRAQHWTRFRLYWRVQNGFGIWSYCNEGNEADREPKPIPKA